jgi:hypothetical protein
MLPVNVLLQYTGSNVNSWLASGWLFRITQTNGNVNNVCARNREDKVLLKAPFAIPKIEFVTILILIVKFYIRYKH